MARRKQVSNVLSDDNIGVLLTVAWVLISLVGLLG